MITSTLSSFLSGDTPVIAAAIHSGHQLREEMSVLTALDDAQRLREEDPFTEQWASVADNYITVNTSRFEMDLNREREKAVYIEPEDAWGLKVWKTKPSLEMINRSLIEYDTFYSHVHKVFSDFQKRFGKFVVFDLHAYNYRRSGPGGEPADPSKNPEVNVGTKTMDRSRWAHIVDRFISDLSEFDFLGRRLDVRENVKFYGRQFAQWTHDNFSDSACVLSIEFKKFFMDEWSGKLDVDQHKAISKALKSTIPGVISELKNT